MSRKKKYWNMTTEELAEATKEFDREGIVETFHTMTPSEEAEWRSATKSRRSRRDTNGKAVKKISVDIEADLPKRADALAKKRGISRAALVTESLERVLASDAT
jgi:hypothetical protein